MKPRLFAIVLAFVFAASSLASLRAADPPQRFEGTATEDSQAATEQYLRRYAVLLGIRATFDVLEEDPVTELVTELRRLGPGGPTDIDQGRLDRALLTEGSYYLVSLRYLIVAGGAAWPADRDGRAYAGDSLVRLDRLERELLDSVASGGDPLSLLLEAQQILWLTEGSATTPASSDQFADRDDIVDMVVEDFGPRTSS